MSLSERTTNILAFFLLAIMFCLAFFSMQGISATMDELAHIPAGYSYLSQKDYRINPEHPPLAKDLSALPLLFLNLNFPLNHPAWQKEVNGQWWLGSEFLYRSGNNPEQIIFWARIPMIFLLLFLGWFLFYWTKKEFGNKVALLTLFFFSFSPTFLAHGRLVTTDVPAALGFVIATSFWLKFLRNPTKKNIILAGLVFGFALLLKFSLILLIPFLGTITLIYAWLKIGEVRKILKYVGMALIAGIIGIIFVIWPVYQFHVINYPPEKQLSDTKIILESNPWKPLKGLCIYLVEKPPFRALGHFLLGLLMATQRTTFGNTVYFLGKISGKGWWYYFPIVYLIKVPLAFHFFTLIAFSFVVVAIKNLLSRRERLKRTKEWILSHFTEFSMVTFLVIYWSTSLSANLNIGVRHILPIFPFTYVLVSLGIQRGWETIRKFQRIKKIAYLFFLFLIIWYTSSSLTAFPHYLSYFNELAGGSKNGYKFVVDSNYDWGQDLKRLAKFVKENKIEKIYVDYFGGGDPQYYLKERYIPYNPLTAKEKPKGWFAVSATLLQGGRGTPEPGFNQPTGYYMWLNQYQIKARAGNSIFIYYIP